MPFFMSRFRSLFPTFWIALLPLWMACRHPAPPANPASSVPLNSEQIEAAFGSYGIDVIRQDDGWRISNLHSVHEDTKICRTLAIVKMPSKVPGTIRRIHQSILEGASIGATFQSKGWQVVKTDHQVSRTDELPEDSPIIALMKNPLERRLPLHRYRLSVLKRDHRIPYATIAEIHHPDYLNPDHLKRFYKIPHYQSSSDPDPDPMATTLIKLATRALQPHEASLGGAHSDP